MVRLNFGNGAEATMSCDRDLNKYMALAVLLISQGCKDNPVSFLDGSSPVSVVAVDRLTASPADFSIFYRGEPITLGLDVHYDFSPQEFVSPRVELMAWARDERGQNSATCLFNLGSITPTVSSDTHLFIVTFTEPPTPDCRSQIYLLVGARLYSGSKLLTRQPVPKLGTMLYYVIDRS
jgi:hypothetical protein